MRRIAALYEDAVAREPAVELLTGAGATRPALLSGAPHARFLHLATHGYYDPGSVPSLRDDRPVDASSGLGRHASRGEQVRGLAPWLLAGLALAGADRPARGGRVTAEELAALDLSGCELAVLSACEGALGERRDGLGLASLQSALLAAGARTVVAAPWRVSDERTAELMAAFYEALWVEGLPPGRALWRAKSAVRARHPSPASWAGWVLAGRPD